MLYTVYLYPGAENLVNIYRNLTRLLAAAENLNVVITELQQGNSSDEPCKVANQF